MFSIKSIMEHNQETNIEPINASFIKFGIQFDDQFVVLDDAKHVIGVDANDARNLILENVENKKTDKFGWGRSSLNYIATLFYDDDTGSLYTGDTNGCLYKYKLDKTSKTNNKVKAYGNLGIGEIFSSHRFLQFVFFGGDQSKIRVLDLSTGELLQGHLETSIESIRSLQLCVKSPNEIYLSVSGSDNDYSDDKTDLFDVSALFLNHPVIFPKDL